MEKRKKKLKKMKQIEEKNILSLIKNINIIFQKWRRIIQKYIDVLNIKQSNKCKYFIILKEKKFF